MLRCMRTTVRLNDGLLAEVKKYATTRRKTFTAVIEEALRETLARQKTYHSAKSVKLTTVKGKGLCQGIDLDDSASLLDMMDARDPS